MACRGGVPYPVFLVPALFVAPVLLEAAFDASLRDRCYNGLPVAARVVAAATALLRPLRPPHRLLTMAGPAGAAA